MRSWRGLAAALLSPAALAGAAAACRPAGPQPRAVAGELDLRAWDFEARGAARLAGEWTMRWARLDGPEAARDPGPPYLRVPGSWNTAQPGGGRLSGGPGFATLALRVRLPEPPPPELALAFGDGHSAERLFVDGRLRLERGQVGRDRESERAGPRPRRVRFPTDGALLEVVLEVSNHFHFEGGLLHAPLLDTPEGLEARLDRETSLDFLILGSLGAIGLYYAFLSLSRPERGHALFVGLAFLVGLRVAVTKWHLDAFLPLGAAGQLRLDYVTLFVAPPAYYALLQELFPEDVRRGPLRFSAGFAALGLLSLALPTWIFTRLREPAIAVAVAVAALAFLAMGRAALRGREGARLPAAASAVVVVFAVHDSLSRLRLITEARELLPLAVAFLVFAHAVVLGLRLRRALVTSEELTSSLQDLNRTLEQRVAERTAELERLATTDALTGVANRGELTRAAEVELARARRHGIPLAVLVVDADHFKEVNDSHGHAAGDAVLREVAARLKGLLRAHDGLGRWGGEEFVLLLPHLDAAGARAAGERVRRAFEGQPMALPDGGLHRLTVSVGAAVARAEESFEEALRRADHALYAAKAGGRNRVCLDEHAAEAKASAPDPPA
jgi:diguanylate cyclase (GGDEF)-like protein